MKRIEGSYYIQKSTRRFKKYDIYKKVADGFKYICSFGDNRYQQFKDSTPIKAYSKLNHGDPERRRRYFLRHGRSSDKSHAKYWANKYLW